MQALGNDYIYVELLTQRMENPSAWARFLSRRRFGVGSDGMILICPSAKADFHARVQPRRQRSRDVRQRAAQHRKAGVRKRALPPKPPSPSKRWAASRELFLTLEDGHVSMITASLGAPILESARVPLRWTAATAAASTAPSRRRGRLFRITAVSMGNPHCATFADDAAKLDLPLHGAAIEKPIPSFRRRRTWSSCG